MLQTIPGGHGRVCPALVAVFGPPGVGSAGGLSWAACDVAGGYGGPYGLQCRSSSFVCPGDAAACLLLVPRGVAGGLRVGALRLGPVLSEARRCRFGKIRGALRIRRRGAIPGVTAEELGLSSTVPGIRAEASAKSRSHAQRRPCLCGNACLVGFPCHPSAPRVLRHVHAVRLPVRRFRAVQVPQNSSFAQASVCSNRLSNGRRLVPKGQGPLVRSTGPATIKPARIGISQAWSLGTAQEEPPDSRIWSRHRCG